MGNGIAHSLAAGGFEVVLVDAVPQALERGMATIEKHLRAGVERGKITPGARAGNSGKAFILNHA